MRLRRTGKEWDKAGQLDPFWAVLSWDDRRGNRWQTSDFFQTGVVEVARLMEAIDRFDIRISRGTALDFGCGPGRLTQALSQYFDQVHGVDIAPSMIALAETLNKQPSKCVYHVNERDDLRVFPNDSFDLVYSNITLQHLRPRYSKTYIREFFRILSPTGLLVFQLPGIPVGNLGLLKRILPDEIVEILRRLRHPGRPGSQMYGISPAEVARLCNRAGGEVVCTVPNSEAGERWQSFWYYCRRRQHAGAFPHNPS